MHRHRMALLFLLPLAAQSQQPCVVNQPTAMFSIPHEEGNAELTLDPESAAWKRAAAESMSKDCSRQIDYPHLKTEIRAFWTDTDLYLLFRCPYKVLNLFLPANNASPHVGLWDRDVVEMFLGDDWTNIRHYREFEIAPTADWIDLAIDLDHQSYDHKWRSRWRTMARIDDKQRIWYAAARIPLSAISSKPVQEGTKWRMNLYRIEGLGADAQRHFLCWQPTCVQNRDPNHVPEHFGTLVFGK
ncbi:MAG: carbohydrate-binding family 9-like protein [Bryobacteraceae bacterium]